MKNLIKATTGLGLICTLAACGGGEMGGKAAGVAFTTAPLIETGSANASFNDDGALTYNGEIVSRATDTKIDNGSEFVHFYNRAVSSQPSGSALANGNIKTIRANTGKTHAFVFGNDASGPLFTQFGRDTETNLPVSGTATYAGKYGGLAKRGPTTQSFEILGDTTFDIDFAAGTSSGTISNRRMAATPTSTFEDIRLVNGAIDANGLIKGTALGGRPQTLPATNLPGRPFEAVIGGTDASEVAGYVRVDWRTDVGPTQIKYNEAGVFVAERQ